MRSGDETTTLFLRGLPVSVVREAKAAAARRGSTLARFVAETLERSLARADEPDSAEYADFDRSMAWYEKNRSRLVRAHSGEYVAIAGGRVIDHDDDFEALALRVFRRVGVGPVFMPRVEREARRMRLRSPRRSVA